MNAKPTSPRKKRTTAEASAYLALVKDAIEAAHAAASAAVAEFANAAERTPEGRIVDVFGGAWVSVYKPTYRFRSALKALGEIQKGDGGAWIVSNFSKHVVREQSVMAHRIACDAARAVLQRRLPDDGEFLTHSYRD